MKKQLLILLSIVLSFSLFLAGCSSNEESSSSETTPAPTSVLDKVKERGKLIVGVNSELPGFGYLDSEGKYVGFDVDFGRAVAAAVLGDANAVEFRPLSSQERFTAVQTGEVDVLFRNATWTTTRDTSVGMNFAPTTFYDGQGMMTRKDSGYKTLKDLEGTRIGVETGTTTELNLTDQLRKAGVSFEAVVFDTQDALISAYEQGSVDAWTTDKSALISRLSTLSSPDEHFIMDVTMSKEPLSPAVKSGDDKWFDAVKWIVFATFQAEEFGINSSNVDEFLQSEDPSIMRFLGTDGDLAKGLELPNDYSVQVIKQIGNYGEIFDRNLGKDSKFNLERGLNKLYTEGGLIYSPPFR